MKKFAVLILFLGLAQAGWPQFVTMPLDYPNNGTAYMSWFTSIVDADNVWVGTVRQGLSGYLPYSMAVKTTDGGYTWEFDSIPVPGTPWIQHLAAWDASTCYYLFTDGQTGGGSVWKTEDGGATWSKKTTTQFQGGWPNIIHAFSADTVLAMGDPNGGYFEIQLTYDGGTTWTRVPASDMPAAISGETGTSGEYCAVGNSIWFGTSKGRCYRSSDRGQHWSATLVVPEYMDFCFTDTLNGIGYRANTSKGFYQTSDGGATWVPRPTNTSYFYGSMSRVPGIYGGFIVTAWDTINTNVVDVLFTTDFFTTATLIDSNITNASFINFKDASTGWIGGMYNFYHNIHKYIGVLSSVAEKGNDKGILQIMPNPSSGETLITVSSKNISGRSVLKIIDLTGKTVFERYVDTAPGWIKLDASAYRDGIYLVELISGNGRIEGRRWVVQH